MAVDLTLMVPADTARAQLPMDAIVAVLRRNRATYTNTVPFWTPQAWREHGRAAPDAAVLVVVHGGSALAPFFDAYNNPVRAGEMDRALAAVGLRVLELTGTTTAIVPL